MADFLLFAAVFLLAGVGGIAKISPRSSSPALFGRRGHLYTTLASQKRSSPRIQGALLVGGVTAASITGKAGVAGLTDFGDLRQQFPAAASDPLTWSEVGNSSAIQSEPSSSLLARVAQAGLVTIYQKNGVFHIPPSVGDLGSAIRQAIAANSSGEVMIDLQPNSTYTLLTPVTNAGPGVEIDCDGSTIDDRYDGNAIAWLNPHWKNLQSEFVHAPTGIADCKFVTSPSNTSMRVGLVSRISQFKADNLTIDYGGAFEIQGEAITGIYTGVRVINPTNPRVWLFDRGPGTFGPNGVVLYSSYCEGVNGIYGGITCYQIDAGSVTIEDSYTEAVSTAISVHGGSVSLLGGSIGLRGFPNSVGIRYDSGGLSISGIQITFGDSGSHTDYAIVFNNPLATRPAVRISDLNILNIASRSASAVVFMARYPTVISLNGGILELKSSNKTDLFDISESGLYSNSTVTGLSVYPSASASASFTSNNLGSVFYMGTITGNAFERIGHLDGFSGTTITGNSFLGTSAEVSFTSPGVFAGNSCSRPLKFHLINSVFVGNQGCGSPRSGVVQLTSGKAIVSTEAACDPGATCNIQLTDCGVRGIPGILSVQNVTKEKSFVIESSSSSDASSVCWRVD